jgi:hypothetical protein
MLSPDLLVVTRGRRDDRPRRDGGAARSGEAPRAGAGEAREFWETWVDERAPKAADAGPATAPRAEAAAAAPPRGDDPASETLSGRHPRQPMPEEPGFVRLYVNVGKREGLATEDITRLVT